MDVAERGASKPRVEALVDCGRDDDCLQFSLGYCDLYSAHCASGCRVDDDCAPARICVCPSGPSSHGGECVLTDCKTDDDCAGEALCASSSAYCGSLEFACQSVNDECASDGDCGPHGCYQDGARRRCR